MTVDRCPGCGLPVIPSAGTFVRMAGCVCLTDGSCQPAKEGGDVHASNPTKPIDPVGGREGREAGTGSDLERAFLALIGTERGLPPHEREYRPIPGRRFRVDFAWPARKLAVEVEGQCHRIRHKFQADCEKNNLLVKEGWRLLRFTGADLRERPAYVIDTVKAALGVGEEG